MILNSYLRTKELADSVQISVQQVRNYEASGFIPVAERSPSGYRLYTQQHLLALKTAKQLINGYGPQRAQQIMQALHQGKISNALALINERHAELDRIRLQLEQTLAALRVLAAQLPAQTQAPLARGLRVGEAAQLVGVRISALRFWEQQGLLQPVRENGSRYRLYPPPQLLRLQIVALLRQANYDFGAIRTTLNELEAGHPQRAVAAVEKRRNELARLSWRCIEAMVEFHTYASEFVDGIKEEETKNNNPFFSANRQTSP